MVPSWRDQARGNSGSRDDRLTFSCQCHLGEQLHILHGRPGPLATTTTVILAAMSNNLRPLPDYAMITAPAPGRRNWTVNFKDPPCLNTSMPMLATPY
ncbi:hypothetical protein B224_5899 [Aeromonas media WS]|nr:hypothetical protein B224_5899 [Aeromonas media WS]